MAWFRAYLKEPKLWELRYIPSYGYCSIYIINRIIVKLKDMKPQKGLHIASHSLRVLDPYL